MCNGTICVCKKGLFTLTVADSYNCVPSDPVIAGFADNNGGLVIALNPYENMTETDLKNIDTNHHQNNNKQNSEISNSAPISYFFIPNNWIIISLLFILLIAQL